MSACYLFCLRLSFFVVYSRRLLSCICICMVILLGGLVRSRSVADVASKQLRSHSNRLRSGYFRDWKKNDRAIIVNDDYDVDDGNNTMMQMMMQMMMMAIVMTTTTMMIVHIETDSVFYEVKIFIYYRGLYVSWNINNDWMRTSSATVQRFDVGPYLTPGRNIWRPGNHKGATYMKVCRRRFEGANPAAPMAPTERSAKS